MSKKLIIIAIIAVLVGGGVYLMQPEPFIPDNSSGDFAPNARALMSVNTFMVSTGKNMRILQQ